MTSKNSRAYLRWPECVTEGSMLTPPRALRPNRVCGEWQSIVAQANRMR